MCARAGHTTLDGVESTPEVAPPPLFLLREEQRAMPRMNIASQVLYNNFTPAAGAKVVIRDLDGIGGREDARSPRR